MVDKFGAGCGLRVGFPRNWGVLDLPELGALDGVVVRIVKSAIERKIW